MPKQKVEGDSVKGNSQSQQPEGKVDGESRKLVENHIFQLCINWSL
jgi:hypothetical protein